MKRIATPLAVVLVLALPTLGHANGVRTLFEVHGDGSSVSILLSNPFLELNPNALLLACPADFNFSYGISVSYQSGWFLNNDFGSAIPTNAHFWIFGFDSASGFRHTTTVGNTSTYYTVLDDARLNSHPEARPIVMRESTPGNQVVAYPVGVEYDATSQRWRIRFENTSHSMPVGATFSVFVPDAGDLTYVHTTTVGNTNTNYTIFNPVGIDSAKQYRIFMTPVFPATVNDEPIGAAWFLSNLIGNVDGTTMPVGVVFHVFVPDLFEDGFEIGTAWLWSSYVH